MKPISAIRQTVAALLAVPLLSPALRADEGMWTFDNPPLKQLQEKYHFTPTQAWLDHLRLSSVRLNDGGSGSFVSPHGLLLTNHHVARGQLQKNSTAEHDYIRDGFYAATPDQEMKSPDLEVDVLVAMENVTGKVNAAVKSAKNSEEEFARRKAATAEIERTATEKTGLRSDVVPLYSGGEYWLYSYKKYTDVRIVFAPEQQIAFYGGDPDNFTYPRYDLDMALFRVYENNKPIETKDYLQWNPKGASDGELVFVSGHPGSTQRLSTYRQLEYQRDFFLPTILELINRTLAVLREFSARGAEPARQAASLIFNYENGLKALEGDLRGLQDRHLMEKKKQDEEDFKAKVMANPEEKKEYGNAWDTMAQATDNRSSRFKERFYRRFDSNLADFATTITEYVAEVKKPDGVRLRGYHEAQLDSLKLQLFSPAPVYPDLETVRMTSALKAAQKFLGPKDPWVAAVLNGRDPQQVAAELIKGTKLADPVVRKTLVEGGQAAVDSSTDPLIVVARKIDSIHREQVAWMEKSVDGLEERAGEQIGKARFAAFGKSTYPDATFTLRLSYGQAKGYPMNGTIAPYKTTFFGLYDRATGFDNHPPFDLPKRYAEGRDKLDLSTPLDFVTDNDVVGGNSGSPVVNRNAEIVGLVFDGNIESLVGDYVFDGTNNRTISVHTAAMTEALSKLYRAEPLLRELLGRQ